VKNWTAFVRQHWQDETAGARPMVPPPPAPRRGNPFAALWRDVVYAVRVLRKSPTYTAVALTVLALGIGSATAIFSIVDAVVLRGLPFDEHDRLVAVLETNTEASDVLGNTTTPQTFLDWRAQQQLFDGLAAVTGASFGLRDAEGHRQTVRALRMTADFLRVLRVVPMLGRSFTTAEESHGRHRVAILSYGLWQRQFGGDPQIVGKTVALEDEIWDVVGVMPRDFAYPVAAAVPTEIYVPPAFRDEDRVRGDSRNSIWTPIGRLKPGVSVEQASGEMSRLAAALDAQYPDWPVGRLRAGDHARCLTLHERLVGKVRSWMLMLLGAVALVLLIACANVASLMLARATVRGTEIAIRSALGASRAAIVRTLLVESVLLSLGGAALGILLAWLGVRAVIPWLPSGLPRVATIGIDVRVLAAAAAAALATGVGFGLVPALQSSRPNLSTPLSNGRSTTASAGSHVLRSLLVVSEIALAVVLVVGAGLFTGSFVKLMRVDTGFDYTRLLVVNVDPEVRSDSVAQASEPVAGYTQRMLEAVRRVPGVQAGAAMESGALPFTGGFAKAFVKLPGGREFRMGEALERRFVTPGYLKLLGVPLLRGRDLSDDDRADTQPVIVVNEAAARKYWPDQDAVGQRCTVGGKERVVVGIVGDTRSFGPEASVRQEGYLPLAQGRVLGATLFVRTAGDPLKVLPAVKAAIWSVNKDQRMSGTVSTLEGFMRRLIAQRRFTMTLFALFGVLGLVISAVGVYGVMAYLVEQRTSEIGVRMALGATPGSVVTMVLRRAGLLIGVGLAMGTGVAWYAGRLAKSFLFELEPTDPRVFAVALTVIALAGLAASMVPARRAASVDPIVALRQD
jgi:putative ABC transport system permease protein